MQKLLFRSRKSDLKIWKAHGERAKRDYARAPDIRKRPRSASSWSALCLLTKSIVVHRARSPTKRRTSIIAFRRWVTGIPCCDPNTTPTRTVHAKRPPLDFVQARSRQLDGKVTTHCSFPDSERETRSHQSKAALGGSLAKRKLGCNPRVSFGRAAPTCPLVRERAYKVRAVAYSFS